MSDAATKANESAVRQSRLSKMFSLSVSVQSDAAKTSHASETFGSSTAPNTSPSHMRNTLLYDATLFNARKQLKEKQLEELTPKIIAFLQLIVKETFQQSSLRHLLLDGVLLCRCAEQLRSSRKLVRYKKSPRNQFEYMDNMRSFFAVCDEMRVPHPFDASYMNEDNDMFPVIFCIQELAKIAVKQGLLEMDSWMNEVPHTQFSPNAMLSPESDRNEIPKSAREIGQESFQRRIEESSSKTLANTSASKTNTISSTWTANPFRKIGTIISRKISVSRPNQPGQQESKETSVSAASPESSLPSVPEQETNSDVDISHQPDTKANHQTSNQSPSMEIHQSPTISSSPPGSPVDKISFAHGASISTSSEIQGSPRSRQNPILQKSRSSSFTNAESSSQQLESSSQRARSLSQESATSTASQQSVPGHRIFPESSEVIPVFSTIGIAIAPEEGVFSNEYDTTSDVDTKSGASGRYDSDANSDSEVARTTDAASQSPRMRRGDISSEEDENQLESRYDLLVQNRKSTSFQSSPLVISDVYSPRSISPSASPETSHQFPQSVVEPSKPKSHRQLIVNEILDTEEVYVRDLNIIITEFFEPIQKQQILPLQQQNDIFSCIPSIYQLNTILLEELKRNPEKIGHAFMKYGAGLKIYSVYCASYESILELVPRLIQTNSAFKRFTKEALTHEQCRGLDLLAFLIKPVQRLCKYPLLLKELLKHTPEDHEDHVTLKNALASVSEHASGVNQRVKDLRNNERYVSISSRLEGHKGSIISPSRKYVWECKLKKLSEAKTLSDRRMIIFNDLLLFVKDQKNQTYKWKESIILTHEYSARSFEEPSEFPYGFEVIQDSLVAKFAKQIRRAVLFASSEEEKAKIIELINAEIENLRDAHRKKELQEDPSKLKKWKQKTRTQSVHGSREYSRPLTLTLSSPIILESSEVSAQNQPSSTGESSLAAIAESSTAT
eukprot:TRINITY_DN3295_c0_g1_i5.p1 TRINITY_DN3295_c0_g1~~TRINITY_DN3295_c0_g1_i5.p1  ORF type:complete len:957 (-),score=199.16 TRINITY_DN3295_c0_g1_i5:390-3260(-)